MRCAVDAAARAIAGIEGDPDQLIEVSTPRGLTRVPAWQLYRVRARAALEAARDEIINAIDDKVGRYSYEREDILRGWDVAVAP